MKTAIKQEIQKIEENKQVKVLFACESGSRAWGFASPDSDYDVRFIYRQARNHYLSIRERKEVIELPVDELLDVNGWDIRKALQLFLKSNGPLYEWLQSPIIYKMERILRANCGNSCRSIFRIVPAVIHYLSMGRNTFENDLQGEQVKLKRYFYALRPLLACLWIIENRSVPPMEFPVLRTIVADSSWQAMVDELLEQKSRSDEKASISPVAGLQGWIARTIDYCKEKSDAFPVVKHDAEALDELFRKYIDL